MELPTKRKTERIAVSDDEGVVMLYVPYLPEHNHEHIEFTDKAVVQLRNWLSKYIKAKGLTRKSR